LENLISDMQKLIVKQHHNICFNKWIKNVDSLNRHYNKSIYTGSILFHYDNTPRHDITFWRIQNTPSNKYSRCINHRHPKANHVHDKEIFNFIKNKCVGNIPKNYW